MSRDNADQSRRIHHWRWIYPVTSTLFALLLGTSWLFAGWLENTAYYYAPLVSMFLLISLIAGIIRSRSNYGPYRLLTGVGSCLFAAAMLIAPYVLVWSWYRLEAAQYAIPNDTWGIEITIDPIRWNGRHQWRARYESLKSMKELETFHVHRLKARGVKFLPPKTYQNRITSIRVQGGAQPALIYIMHEGTDRRVAIWPIYDPDNTPPELKELSNRINRWIW